MVISSSLFVILLRERVQIDGCLFSLNIQFNCCWLNKINNVSMVFIFSFEWITDRIWCGWNRLLFRFEDVRRFYCFCHKIRAPVNGAILPLFGQRIVLDAEISLLFILNRMLKFTFRKKSFFFEFDRIPQNVYSSLL